MHGPEAPKAAQNRQLRRLQTAGRRLAKAREQESVQMAEIEKLVPVVRELGVSKARIAREARISRPTLDAILRRQA